MKGQTALEYIILLAMVLIILTVAIAPFNKLAFISSSFEERAVNMYWQNADIGIVSHTITTTNTTLAIQNNLLETINVTAIYINNTVINDSAMVLVPGEVVLATSTFTFDDEFYSFDVIFNYTVVDYDQEYQFFGQSPIQGATS